VFSSLFVHKTVASYWLLDLACGASLIVQILSLNLNRLEPRSNAHAHKEVSQRMHILLYILRRKLIRDFLRERLRAESQARMCDTLESNFHHFDQALACD
jgi:hypothetical protein